MAELLCRLELDAARLWSEHPPVIHHEKKQAILDAAGGRARSPRGTMQVTRWGPSGAPPVGASMPVESIMGPFRYPRVEANTEAWHVNFADTHLFAFYGIGAFAQDEIQVAEHPLLASVREYLLATQNPAFRALTREPGKPTPVLVKGVERWCTIDADGIYGRQLSRATDERVGDAVTRVEATSNILAIVAPQGEGRYTKDDIEDVLVTAVTGFSAARTESVRQKLRIHTGHWGTGAFGGNRVLMAAAQVLAARMVGVDELAYHSLDDDAEDAFRRGLRIANDVPAGTTLAEVVTILDARGFIWGSSDGN